MPTDQTITLFYSPQTRATGVRLLLEELGAPYALHVLNMKAGEQRGAAYRAINPLGKVPAILHGDALVTEQGAIYTYLADLFPEAGLAPALTDPLRGPYLRWMFLYGSCLEPAVTDRFMERAPSPASHVALRHLRCRARHDRDAVDAGPLPLRRRNSPPPTSCGARR